MSRSVWRVHAGGRFVEDEDRRVLEQRPRDRDALFFADAQLHAALADHGLQAFRQALDELRAHSPRRALSHNSASVASGLPSRRLSRIDPLKRKLSCVTMPTARAQRALREIAQRLPIDQNLAASRTRKSA